VRKASPKKAQKKLQNHREEKLKKQKKNKNGQKFCHIVCDLILLMKN
jgi:hypothetical protein